jgi:hypothetical protein
MASFGLFSERVVYVFVAAQDINHNLVATLEHVVERSAESVAAVRSFLRQPKDRRSTEPEYR